MLDAVANISLGKFLTFSMFSLPAQHAAATFWGGVMLEPMRSRNAFKEENIASALSYENFIKL
jgi:hypothetical protein